MSKRLLAYRDFSGYGDWLMAMTVLKHVNIQYPDIEIYIDLRTHGPLDEFILAFIEEFGIRFKGVIVSEYYNRRNKEGYDYVTGHMIYNKCGVHLIEDMIDVFNRNTGLSVKYDEGCKATIPLQDGLELPNEFVVMPIQGKSLKEGGKEWGRDNFVKLYSLLCKEVTIIQVGFQDDPLFPGIDVAHTFLGRDLLVLAEVMQKSLFGINIVNFLCHFYGHHEKKQYTIYGGEEQLSWTKYSNQIQLSKEKVGMISPERVYEIIMKESLNA